MAMSKEERVDELRRKVDQLIIEERLKWLNRVCREARDAYGFSCLGDLVAFMFDHAGDIQVKSGDTTLKEG
jgi:hypothetical protein